MRRTEPSWLEINWRKETGRLRPYCAAHGGVVCICGSPSAACNTFSKLLRVFVEDSAGISIQLNPDDATTHTPVDIIMRLESKLGIQEDADGALNVATGIQAGGDVSISNIDVVYNATPFQVRAEQARRTQRLISTVCREAKNRKIAIILHNWHKMPRTTHRWFWESVWSNGLTHAVVDGLTLFVVDETSDGEFPDSEAYGVADCVLRLPARYTESDRDHAVDDVAGLLLSLAPEGQYEDEHTARARADSLLIAWAEQPAKVHAGLNAYRLALQSRL